MIPNNTIIPSTDSQDYDTQMDLRLMNESVIIEPNVVVSSNVETKSFPTETQKIILKNAAIPSKDSHDKNKSNKNQNSENKIGSPNLTNEVSENISDAKKYWCLR